MRKYIHIYSILFCINSVMVSCQSKTQNKEANTTINLLKMKQQFPNQKIAFEKINNKVSFYKPDGSRILMIDLKQFIYNIYSPDIYCEGLIKINNVSYFLPVKIERYQTFSTEKVGTVAGILKIENVTNEIGLLVTEKSEYPIGNDIKINDISYEYNKFGQLLNVQQNRKAIVRNTYDNKGNLIESKTSDKQIKYNYNNEGIVVSEELDKQGEKRVIKYQYNSSKQLVRKYTDDQNQVEEFKYDSKGRIVSVVEYVGKIDQSDSNKLVNHFIKRTYVYTNDQLTNEKQLEYKITNTSVLVNKKWEAINIERQRKLAWAKIDDSSEIPYAETEKNYTYLEKQIRVLISGFGFSNRIKNGELSQEKEALHTESIIFFLDDIGRIIKKETIDRDKKTIVEKYYY